jgi:transcriptional regulator with XRE-family HTH domain
LGESSGLTIGEVVKQIRIRSGLSSRAASELCGLSPAYLSKVETNSTIPSSKALIKILSALGCSAEEMLYVFGILYREDPDEV